MMNKKTTQIIRAAQAIKDGKLVAFPTETVYGLGADATSDEAVAAIYSAKGRPSFNPLIVHVHSLDQLAEYIQPNALAEKLAGHFWPGPLTLVMKRETDCKLSLLVSAGLDSVAVRIPNHPVAHSLLEACQLPIAAPSANRSGRISPTEARHVEDELGDQVAMILDGGACNVGLESTVIDVTTDNPVILRPGYITKEMIIEIVGEVGRAQTGDYILSPGMLARHYAPNARLRLNAETPEDDEALLAFGRPIQNSVIHTENLSPTANLKEAAANLFGMLRKLDELKVEKIAVMPIPGKGVGVAINDRLRRAATR